MPTESESTTLAQADRQLRAEIEAHRTAMGKLGQRRATLVAAEVHRRGRTGVAEVAAELGLSESAIRRLVALARTT